MQIRTKTNIFYLKKSWHISICKWDLVLKVSLRGTWWYHQILTWMLAFESIIFLSFKIILHLMCHLIVFVSAHRNMLVWKREKWKIKSPAYDVWMLTDTWTIASHVMAVLESFRTAIRNSFRTEVAYYKLHEVIGCLAILILMLVNYQITKQNTILWGNSEWTKRNKWQIDDLRIVRTNGHWVFDKGTSKSLIWFVELLRR